MGNVTVNKELYIDTLHRLRNAVRRKRSEKWRTNSWFLLNYSAPAHRSVLAKNCLAKINMTPLEHPPFSPDLAAAYFACPLYWSQHWKTALLCCHLLN